MDDVFVLNVVRLLYGEIDLKSVCDLKGSTKEFHPLCTGEDNCQIRIVCHLCIFFVFISWLF